ncbi:MAG: M56 family metallopeptidase [Planctomycetaceae bacterium]
MIGLLGGWRLIRSATMVQDNQVLRTFQLQVEQLGLHFVPAIAWCERVAVPVVVGIIRPTVLLPPSLLTGLEPEQLEAILVHELAHVRRFDPLLNLLQRSIECVFFFHPAIWYVSRHVSREREICCDDLVVKSGTKPVTYATALVRMGELCSHRVMSPGLAVTGSSGSEFKQRVLRLLTPEPTVHAGQGFALSVLMLVVFGSASAAYAWLPQDDGTGWRPGHPEGLIAVLGEDRARFWGNPTRLHLSPDEKRVYLIESNGFVSAYDTQSLERVMQCRPHKVRCLDMALVDTGQKLVTISADGTVALHDLNTEQPNELDRLELLPGQDSGRLWMNLAAGARTNRIVVRCVNSEGYNRGEDDSGKQSMIVLDVKEGRFSKRAEMPAEADAAWQFAISDDGKWLVTSEEADGFEDVKQDGGGVWRLQNANLVVRDLKTTPPKVVSELPSKAIERLHFDPTGRLWAPDPPFLGSKRKIHTWSIRHGRLVGHTSIPGRFGDGARQRTFNMDASIIAVTSLSENKQGLVLTKGDSTTEVAQLPGVTSSVFLRDGSLITTGAQVLRRWNRVGDEYHPTATPVGHQSSVNGLLFDPRTNSLLTSADDVREWDLTKLDTSPPNDGRVLPFENIVEMWIWPQGRGFLLRRAIDGENVIQGVRRSGTKMVSRFKLSFGDDYRQSPWCAALHPTKSILATGHWDSHIRMWDIGGSKPKQLCEWKAHRGHVCDVVFEPNGKSLVSAGWDHETKRWVLTSDCREPPANAATVCKHVGIVRSVAYSSDSRFIASGGEDDQILLWDRDNPDDVRSLMHPEDGAPKANRTALRTPNSLQFNQTGDRLFSGDGAGRVTIWSIPDGKILKRWQLPGWIRAVRLSLDESMIATGNYDGTVFLLKADSEATP